MALIKIYTKPTNADELRSHIANSIKLVGAAALNVEGFETAQESVETAYIEAIDIIGIDYICEIIGVERPNQQKIADDFIKGLNEVYPDKLFSVYFVNISEVGMSNTPRPSVVSHPITMSQAIERSRSGL